MLGGTQVVAPVTAPIAVTGNGISLLGDSTVTGNTGTTPTASAPAPQAGTSGDDAVLGGTQLIAPITLPITLGGNAVSVAGDSTVTTPGTNPGTDPGTDPGTEPGTDPGADPGTDPGTDTGTTPSTGTPSVSGATSSGAAVAVAAQQGLAMTGGSSAFPLIAAAALLLLIGAGLLGRRVTA